MPLFMGDLSEVDGEVSLSVIRLILFLCTSEGPTLNHLVDVR